MAMTLFFNNKKTTNCRALMEILVRTVPKFELQICGQDIVKRTVLSTALE